MKYPFYILALMFIGFTQTKAQNLLQTELLGRPTNNSVTVQAFFDAPVEACVQYGTTSGIYPNQTTWQTFPAGEPAEIVVSGLQANTKLWGQKTVMTQRQQAFPFCGTAIIRTNFF